MDIVEDTSVGELKIAITSALRYTGRPDKLQLYLAKKGSAWLTERDVLEGVSDLNDDNRLKFARATLEVVGLASDQLGKVSDEDAAGGLGPVHVVVEIAEEKSVTRKTRARSENDDQRLAKRLKATEVEKWEWKEEEPVYYRKGRLFFVNREKAVQDLVKFHERKFKRANQGIGDTWVIPLLDNDYGFGKTRFGSEYIRRCQSLERDSTMVRGFMDTLCSCHTIPISLIQMQVLEKNGDFHAEKASRSLIDCIRAFFKVKYVTLPHAFDKPEETYAILLANLTEEVEPLFIVIDEIGLAFNHNKLDDFARSEQFIKFCKVLQPLFENQKLFFLIAGRASFLNHVARRPLGTGSITTNSPFLFKRLDLHLLRHEAIKTIIKNTRWEEATSDTIQDHLQLTEDQVTKAADHLFDTTLGHPRSLLVAFETCESYDELFNYVPDVPIKGVEWNSFFEKLWLYRNPLEHLMGRALDEVETDLSECWTDNGGTEISYETTVSEFGIGWEGSIHAALLYMPSYIQKPILATVYPSKELLEKVAPAISHISIDYPDVFELLCLSRFQEMFQKETRPRDALPSFFTMEQWFGRCDGVQFADRTFRMPKITTQSKNKSPSLASKTAHPGRASIVMAEAGKKYVNVQTK